MDRTEILERGDANLCAYLRHLAANAPDGSYDESAGVLTFAGGHAYPGTYTNGVIRKGDDTNADTVLERARAFFRPLRRGYAIWVRDHADSDLEVLVRQAGLFHRPPLEGNPRIAYSRGRLPVPDLGPDVIMRRADDDTTRRHYLECFVAGYGIGGLPFD